MFAVNAIEYPVSAAMRAMVAVDSKTIAGYDESCITVISFSEARSTVKTLIFWERIDAAEFCKPGLP